MNTPLLQIKDLHTDIEIRSGVVRALSGVDLHVNPGETLGIVGESGSGKTMTALSLMGLLPQGGRVSSGSIILDGQDLTQLPLKEKRKLRGTKVGMIFQDPLTSLNPTMKIGLQVCEPLRVHEKMSKKDALERAVEILKRVGMPRPEVVINNYPHQLSGGMRQRVMIAMALVCQPRILIADEPTTALDVTTQMQILDLIDELRDEYKMGVILITHDLGVVAGHTNRVAVMYAGRIVETAPTKTLFTEPRHRYTSSLMAALPERALAAGTKLFSIPGAPPSLTNLPVGCRFAARCLWATDECRAGYPDLSGDENHSYACFHPVQDTDESPALLQAKLDAEASPEGTEDAARAANVPVATRSHDALLDVKEASREYESAGSGFFNRNKGLRSTGCRSRSRRARPTVWWASPAAVSPPWVASSPALSLRRAERSSCSDATWPRSRAVMRSRCTRTSR